MTSSLEVVITVPHAACPPDPDPHWCDFAAPEIARALHRAIPRSELIESEVHRDPGQIAVDGRPGSDQNRPWGRRDTEFRRRLDAAFDRRPDLLIDVHSFGEGAFGEGINMVILDPSPTFAPDRASAALVGALRSAGVRAAIVQGSNVNSIVVEARARGIKAVLAEFGERLGANERNRAISAMTEWAAQMTSPVHQL